MAADAQTSHGRIRLGLVAVGATCAILFAVCAYRAWVCDDAYITFRTVDNAVSGYGLHSMHGGGFMMQLLAILMFFVGFPLWAIIIWRVRKYVVWQRAIPVLWILYTIGLFYHVFADDPGWLYPMYGIDIGFIADIFGSISSLLIGFVLLSGDEK